MMKLHWGHKITIAFVVFATFILSLMVKMMRQQVDMVTDDYYAKELVFQQTIDERGNADRLGMQISVDRSGDELLVTVPGCHSLSTGTLYFYKPDDRSKDLLLDLHTDDKGEQRVSSGMLGKGTYELIVRWKTGDIQYEQQRHLIISNE